MITIEPLVLLVRMGPRHEKYGDEYAASVTVIIDKDTKTAKAKGLAGAITRQDYLTVKRMLMERYGVSLTYTRVRNGILSHS